MEYNQYLIEETIGSQIEVIRAKIKAIENNLYKLSQPIELSNFDRVKENFSTIVVDWDSYDSVPQYDRVFYCFLVDMIYWLDHKLDLMGLLEEAETQRQFEIAENKRNQIEMMLGLVATDEDEDPYGTILNKGYEQSLEQN